MLHAKQTKAGGPYPRLGDYSQALLCKSNACQLFTFVLKYVHKMWLSVLTLWVEKEQTKSR